MLIPHNFKSLSYDKNGREVVTKVSVDKFNSLTAIHMDLIRVHSC